MTRKKTDKMHVFKRLVVAFLVACMLGTSLPAICQAETNGQLGDNYTEYT